MKPLVERLADELAWWINWAHDAESVPPRSFESARRDGMALLEELDPRRVGKPLRGSAYTRDHLLDALSWIERSHSQGIRLVARALANTGRCAEENCCQGSELAGHPRKT